MVSLGFSILGGGEQLVVILLISEENRILLKVQSNAQLGIKKRGVGGETGTVVGVPGVAQVATAPCPQHSLGVHR